MNVRHVMSTLGAGAKVMVMDSGVRPEPYLDVMESRNFTDRPMAMGADHGTDMAAIIGSRDPMCLGIAPYCDLYVAKVFTHGRIDWRGYEQALDWAIEAKIDVVNMSFGLMRMSGAFEEKLKLLDERGTICVAAHSQFNAFDKNAHVLTVGRMAPNSLAQVTTVGVMSRRAANGGYRSVRGTSVSAAVMSGIAACVKAAEPAVDRPLLIEFLSDNEDAD